MTAFPRLRLGELPKGPPVAQAAPLPPPTAIPPTRLRDISVRGESFDGVVSHRGGPLRPRPRVRAKILRERLCPAAPIDTPDGMSVRALRPDELWNEHTAAYAAPDGTIPPQAPVSISPGTRKELKLMLREQRKEKA